VPIIEQPLDQGLPGEAGASRDQNAHNASFCNIFKFPNFTNIHGFLQPLGWRRGCPSSFSFWL
jgi:hypothetical protein